MNKGNVPQTHTNFHFVIIEYDSECSLRSFSHTWFVIFICTYRFYIADEMYRC